MSRFTFFSARVDPFIKAFLVSDALLYASLNIVTVFFAVFTTTLVSGGSLAAATWSLTFGYASRIFAELILAKSISRRRECTKVLVIILGMLLISAAYLGLALVQHASWLYVWWTIGGFGWGLALPTKLAVVSSHIDRTQANQEWGLNDAANMALIGITTCICGTVAAVLGLRALLIIAALLNTLGVLPYLLVLYHHVKARTAKQASVLTPGQID